ncbi:MAG: ABC transporter substrate-binding protein [Spirochaetales bacterium]
MNHETIVTPGSRRRRNRIAFAALLFALSPVLVYAGGQQEQDDASDSQRDAAEPEQTDEGPSRIVIAMNDDPDSLDPHRSSASITEQMMLNVFDGLMVPNVEGTVEPGIAESYEVSDDGLEYTFTLRDDVFFHNGEPVSAEDVVYSYDRLRGAGDEEALTSELDDVESIDIIDDRTVRFTLSQVNSSFLAFLYRAVLPEGYDRHDEEPIGAGPYRFASYEPGDRVVLERFEDYYGDGGSIDEAVFRIMDDGEAQLLALEAGEIDLAGISAERAEEFEDDFTLVEALANSVFIFGMNNDVEPFDDLRVRRAMNHALDVEEIMDFALFGYGEPLGSSMSPAMPEYFVEDLVERYPHDPEGAQELLEEAGYEDGFSFTLTISGHSDLYIDTAQVMEQQLGDIGIDVDIEVVEFGIWLDDVYTDRDYEATLIDFTGKLDPYPILRRYVSDYDRNFLNHDDPDYDEIIETALRETDEADRTEHYREAQRLVTEETPAVFMYDYQNIWALNPDFEGYTAYPFFFHDLTEITRAR